MPGEGVYSTEHGKALKISEQGDDIRTEHLTDTVHPMIWREETVVTETGEVALKIVKSRVPEGLTYTDENRNRKEGNESPKTSEVDPK